MSTRIDTPLAVLSSGVRRRQTSPEAAVALLHLRRAGSAAVLLFGASWIPGGFGNLLAAIVGIALLVELVRAHLPHVTFPRVWVGVLGLPALLALIPPVTEGAHVFLLIGLTSFFVFRRHRVFRVLDSRQCAAIFGATVGVLVLAALAPEPPEARGGFGEVVRGFHVAAWWGLMVAAVTTALHLFLGIRLHFLRLRPKLAVAGFLIATVPAALITVLAVFLAVSVVGGSHSSHAVATLDAWLDAVNAGDVRGPGALGEGFGAVGGASREAVPAPVWRDELADAIEHAAFDLPEGFWLRHEGELWAIRLETLEGGGRRLAGGRRLDVESVQRLADQIRCEVGFFGNGGGGDGVDFTVGGSQVGGETIGEGDAGLRARPTAAADTTASEASWMRRWLVFGGATVEILALERGALEEETLLIGLRTRVVDLVSLLTDPSNQINQAVGVGLVVIAVLFLILQAFALYFGLRIVGGITNAVGGLHKATQRLATGDLDVTIDLPNQDEFGELAEGFNEMTRAIRIAQDQIVQKQRLEQEIATARRIQMRLLPSEVPQLAGYQLAGGSTPSKQVGGDYFDFIPLPDGRLAIAVADVSGKGIPAALLMSNIQASLQGQLLHDAPVTDVVGRMNELLARSTDAHMFATFYYGVLDPETGRMQGVNAGHEPPLVIRADGSMEELPAGGLILGMLPGQTYAACEALLEPGDVMVLYTDGITEAMGPGTRIPGLDLMALPSSDERTGVVVDDDDDDEEIVTNFFGEERLKEVAVAHRHADAETIRTRILDAVSRHVRDVPQSDDVTLVVIKRDAA